jgi:SAM-dependent methyltransferase
MTSHADVIVDQFTRQADAFAASAAIRDEQVLQRLVAGCDAGGGDDSLDVACGPGLVVCAFAGVVRSACGIDLTPAMIRKGEALAASKGLANTRFAVGDVNALPYDAGAFSIVTSRYAFHHFEQPIRVLREMVRVCRSGGRVAMMDMVAPEDPVKAERFHRMECLRDPSHAGAQTLAALVQLFGDAGLAPPSIARFEMPVELDALLRTSFPNPGDRERVRDLVLASLDDDGMGVRTRRHEGKVWFSYPLALLVSTRGAAA